MTDFNAALDVGRGLHALLSSSLLIRDRLGDPPRLYDDPPEDPVFPYLTYGPMRSEDISADGAVITAHMLTLHVWSRYNGRAEMLGLLGAITTALEADDLPLDGAALVSRHILLTDIFRSPDGLTLHGVIRLRVTTDRELETL